MDAPHHDVEHLLGVYALDAVDDEERALVEAHLAGCPRCRAEVDGHREVASHLAQGGAPAPDALWDRIADAIAGETPPPMRLVVDTPADPEPPPAVVPSRRWRRVTLVAAAAVVAVALVSLGAVLGGDDDPGRAELAEVAVAAFESPEARTADLVDGDGEPLVRVAMLPDGTGYVLAGSLPDLDDGIYQLWGSDGETVVSLGAMGPAPGIVAFHADPAHTTLMITEEDEPVDRSTNEPIALGELT